MSKLWVSRDCASLTSHGSVRYFSFITSKGDMLGGFPLSENPETAWGTVLSLRGAGWKEHASD